MLAADVDWQAIGSAAGGIAAIVGIPLAAAAWVTAKQAKRQAEAAETMAELAEAEQTRATEPRLKVGSWSGGFAKVQINGPQSRPWDQEVVVYVENLRPVRAELGEPRLNGQLGQFVVAQCEPGQEAIITFPAEAIEPDRSIPHELSATIRVPESGRTGRFTARLYLQGGGWNAAGERVEFD